MRSWLLVILGAILSILVVSSFIYSQKGSFTPPTEQVEPQPSTPPTSAASSNSTPEATGAISPLPAHSGDPATQNSIPDLTVDPSGLSKTTVVIQMEAGTIKFKLYPNEAPKTVKRIVELIQHGFYNGLTFHRVVPGFVIQGGDPAGNGTGGSGQKLDAEFNQRKHVEGAVAMARSSEVNSADSQFYISLGTHPHLDNKYTVFGQVIEGIDVAKKIKAGDKMTSVSLQ